MQTKTLLKTFRFLLTFNVELVDTLNADALETDLNNINTNIATNPAITASGQSASPGTIGKFRDHPKVSLLGVVALLGIARLFRQIGSHSRRFVLCSYI